MVNGSAGRLELELELEVEESRWQCERSAAGGRPAAATAGAG
ncbi:hypothetical protein ACH47Z_30340 [Streptomyces sp. NPDC020192]